MIQLAVLPEDVKKQLGLPVGGGAPAAPKAASPTKSSPPPPKVQAPPAAAPSKPTLADLQLRLETLRNLEKQMDLNADVIADIQGEKRRLKFAIRSS